MVLNKNYYEKRRIHKSVDKEQTFIGPALLMHKSFVMKGKYNFDGLDLREYGWKKIHALTPQQKNKLEKSPHHDHIDYLETMVYSGPQGIAVAYLNYNTNIHNIDIVLSKYLEDNIKRIEILKSMFEHELEGKLNEMIDLN
jgi:hypothetical protein